MIDMIKETMRKHGFDAAVSFSTINEKCAKGLIPIIYRRPEDAPKAHEFHELWQRDKQLDCHPYRINVAAMPEMANALNSTFWNLAQGIKAAIDPNDICRRAWESSAEDKEKELELG
jgi:hypothetical protein